MLNIYTNVRILQLEDNNYIYIYIVCKNSLKYDYLLILRRKLSKICLSLQNEFLKS
jgi:hypothetical protein